MATQFDRNDSVSPASTRPPTSHATTSTTAVSSDRPRTLGIPATPFAGDVEKRGSNKPKKAAPKPRAVRKPVTSDSQPPKASPPPQAITPKIQLKEAVDPGEDYDGEGYVETDEVIEAVAALASPPKHGGRLTSDVSTHPNLPCYYTLRTLFS